MSVDATEGGRLFRDIDSTACFSEHGAVEPPGPLRDCRSYFTLILYVPFCGSKTMRVDMVRNLKVLLSGVLSVGIAVTGIIAAPAATAADNERRVELQQAGFTGWSAATKTVISKTLLTSTYRGKALPSMYCHGSSTSGCDIARSVALTNTTQTSYGLSSAQVSAQLGLSTSSSTTTTATCHAPKRRGVQGYETGSRYKYKVRSVRKFINAGRVTSLTDTKTTGWLYAYRPRGVLCVATA